MGENEDEKQSQAGQVFENFVQASTCKGTLQAFNILTRHLDLDPLDHRNFYSKLKSKVTTWKAKALWYKLDKRGSHKEYKRGKSCMNTKCLIIGGGPCGLRTAIELAYLGAKVVVVEKRDTFSRNNVLHLWPFTIHDLRGLGAKKFYGKFCAGSIDHISIRQLQLILFKVALMLGVEIHVNVEFVKVLEPPEDQENQKIGWRAEFLPADHSLSDFEFDVIIGADGRRNTLEGFRRKEFRGKLAIAITANFINRNSTAEAKVEEISGVAFIFNQKFFQDLKEETGIDLENIVYYKDCTHYFVMTAKKQSLLDKGVIINDFIDTEMLLCAENVNQDNLLSYAREAADFATNYQLPSLDFALNHYGQPDVAMFDFTSMYASENAALVRERQSHQLLVALVGDSLLEPFWPMGTGCARGFLAAFDTAWMVKSWDQGTPPLELLAERESLYRLLPQTTPENINKNFEQYTLDPGTRYPNLNSNCVRPHQVKHLYITKELHQCPLERLGSVRRSMSLSRRELDIRPSKLLTWCQQQTEGYQHVNVTDLTTSWRSGLALCAIIHRFRPELINFDSLNEDDAVENNQLAFDVAEREFGIPPVTTGKEMASAQEPDKLSMVMYLSKFYELFRGTPLRPVDSWGKNYGENADLSLAKSSISHNYLNLTFPRKRTPRVDTQTEDSDMNKRRRKVFNNLDEPSAYPSRGLRSSPEGGNGREGGGQNKVKSMASQLLAKFEESSRNPSLPRQECRVSGIGKPVLRPSSDPPVNSRCPRPEEPTPSPSPPLKRQFPSVVVTGHVLRELKQVSAGGGCPSRPWRARAKSDLQLGGPEAPAGLPPACQGALALSGVLRRLQQVEDKILQKRAQNLANREFHKKNIKEKAAHLASMFGHGDFPQNKLLSKGLSLTHPPASPSCLPSPDPAATSSPSTVDSVSPARKAKKSPSDFHFHPSHLRTVRPQLTVGKVSSGIGAAAEVLVNLYMNDHRPKTQATSPDLESMRKVFPLNLGGSDTCYFCRKRVYVMERLSAEGHFFHRECFRCSVCATTLRLAAYAFDGDEGKFFCKPHFIHFKTNSQQRKRRAELKQQREEEGPWKEQEAPRRDTPVESSCAAAAIGTPEGSPSDEPTSPKKPKSVLEPEPSDVEGEATSLLPSEWTSVRISPGEDVVGQDMMAVCVLVTSDDGSSDAEPDCPGSEASSAQPCEERSRRPEPPPLAEPLTRHSSLREAPTRKVSPWCPEESQAMHAALQRASSFQSPTPSKYQSWRRKFQSSLTPVNNKRTMSPSKEPAPLSSSSLSAPSSSPPSFSSASVPGNALDGVSLPQVTADNLPSQVSRGHSSPSTPIFLRRARAQGVPKDMPLYLPHGQVLERAEYCMVWPGEGDLASPQLPSPAETASDGCQEAEAPLGDTRSILRGPHPTGGQDRCLPDQELSPRAGEDLGEKNTRPRRGEEDGSEVAEGKKLGLKKLVLTPEQKTKLLDWDDSIAESVSLEAGAQPAPRRAGNGRGGRVLKSVSPVLLPQTAKEPPPAQGRAQEKPGTPAERAPPKSPLRLIANAIRRSLEPLLPNSEGGRKASAKQESKTSPTRQLHAGIRSFSLRKTSSSKDGNQQSLGKDMASRASAFFSLGSPPAGAAQPSYPSPPDLALRTHSLPSRPSKVFPALMSPPCHKMEDVPTLLEKVSLQETFPDASRAPKGKISLFPSLRLKDKSFESSLQESKQRKDLQDLFSTPRGAGELVDSAQRLEKLVQPFSRTCLGPRVHPPSPDKDANPKHIPIQAQVTAATSSASCTSSSSADEDFHPQPSLRSKERKTLRRRRKLEKATKQLVKQEELKRLHKAQAIQRQLAEVEQRQRASEIQGVRLEKALRGEADSGAQDEAELLQEWFKLALEKNKLMRYESELLIMAQELELEDHQSRLQQKLRQKMLKEESQKDENDLNEEREIFSEMMQVIDQRDRLVDSLEEQRIKEKAEDQHFESFIFSRGCQLSRT
ncbi:LOW QUALITY PROTEIN: F-actin-monooxygenase MICAL2 [Ursus americanus]|uniref:LOW QUALITY PROTEIN: F-actin-monooxygenase MICAL2 n=1 Tax=Ursus americanus TaxID=9643 RepID=UPI001E679CC9|nr:LOW QUALITY PROTEIN: F-actin-monooxygenase MICAL2 [Ursus americanus]